MFENANLSLFQWLSATPFSSPWTLKTAEFVATYGIGLAPVALTALWIFGGHVERRASVTALLAAILALAAAGLTSSIVFHPRPFMDGSAPNMLDHAADSSMPSDHTAILFAVAIGLLGSGSRPAGLLGRAMLLCAVAVGWARVYLGVHYPLDVAVGAIYGAMAAWVLHRASAQRLASRTTALGARIYEPLVVHMSTRFRRR